MLKLRDAFRRAVAWHRRNMQALAEYWRSNINGLDM